MTDAKPRGRRPRTTPRTFTLLSLETRTHITTEEAAHHLNLRPQTLRAHACFDTGVIRPHRIPGYSGLLWPVAEIKTALSSRRVLSDGQEQSRDGFSEEVNGCCVGRVAQKRGARMNARTGHELLPAAPVVGAPLCLYLSGPMTGLPELNYPAFNRAASVLRDMGYDVRNPAELVPPYMWAIRRGAAAVDWRDWMRVALALMLQCDEIVMLDEWQESKGACMERDTAQRLGWIAPTLAQVLAGEIDGRGR